MVTMRLADLIEPGHPGRHAADPDRRSSVLVTTRTVEGQVRWAIHRLETNPYHQGARAFLESIATGEGIYAGDARRALGRAARAREHQSPPAGRDRGDWPGGMGGAVSQRAWGDDADEHEGASRWRVTLLCNVPHEGGARVVMKVPAATQAAAIATAEEVCRNAGASATRVEAVEAI